MLYVLKRKDEIVTLVDFLEDGSVYKFHFGGKSGNPNGRDLSWQGKKYH